MKLRFLVVSLMVCVVPLKTMAQTPGVTTKSILLGQSAAFSGPAAQLGIQMNLGTKAYFDHVNAQGGVYGRKIELKTRDDRYEANLCVENTKKFIDEDKVFALISYVGTPTTRRCHAGLPPSQGAAGGALHRRRIAARSGESLHLQRARELLQRDREDRRTDGLHRQPQDRRVLPGRCLRPGRSEG